MVTLVPDYYKEFRCIANRCRHSCCIGWDISIDDASYARYKKDGLLYISEEEPHHFIVDDSQCCPYLQRNGLCTLIIKKGEGYLCQTCTDHPRFRNFWTGITEIGLGLSCEEAARIILTGKTPFSLQPLEGHLDVASLPEDERYLWEVRKDLLSQARQIADPMSARLFEYFVFRYIADALYDGHLKGRIGYVQYCVNTIVALWDESEDQSEAALIEIARAFSYDTEYDQDTETKQIEQMDK